MPEPRTEWGKELKAQSETLQTEFSVLQSEVNNLCQSLSECNIAVRDLTSDLGELRQFQHQVNSQLDNMNDNVNRLLQYQEGTRIQLSWMKWTLGIGAGGLIAIGIFMASSLMQLSGTTAKLEATLQKLQVKN